MVGYVDHIEQKDCSRVKKINNTYFFSTHINLLQKCKGQNQMVAK